MVEENVEICPSETLQIDLIFLFSDNFHQEKFEILPSETLGKSIHRRFSQFSFG